MSFAGIGVGAVWVVGVVGVLVGTDLCYMTRLSTDLAMKCGLNRPSCLRISFLYLCKGKNRLQKVLGEGL